MNDQIKVGDWVRCLKTERLWYDPHLPRRCFFGEIGQITVAARLDEHSGVWVYRVVFGSAVAYLRDYNLEKVVLVPDAKCSVCQIPLPHTFQTICSSCQILSTL